MTVSSLIFILEIVILCVAVILIFASLFKQSSTREALSSISGGSQQLFLRKKVQLSSSLLWLLLSGLSLLLLSLIITLRVVINLN